MSIIFINTSTPKTPKCPNCGRDEHKVEHCKHCDYVYPEEGDPFWWIIPVFILLFIYVFSTLCFWFMESDRTLVDILRGQLIWMKQLLNRIY